MAKNKIQRDILSSFTGRTIFHFEPASLNSPAYPLDLEPTLVDESLFFGDKDPRGLPIGRFPSYGDIYLPTRIAAFGLAHFNRYLVSKNVESKIEFLKAADWFMEDEGAIWYYNHDYGELRAPWISGMAQGEAMSVLVRAFRFTADVKYIEQARKALVPLAKSIADGGVRSRIEDQHDFIEEYPFQTPHHTLNGFMYCLIGLLDLAEVSTEIAEEISLHTLTRTLEMQIDRWDTGFWTTYDLHSTKSGRKNLSTMLYHRVHISLLTYLAAKLESTILEKVVIRWNGYSSKPFNRMRALCGKIIYRIDNPHVPR